MQILALEVVRFAKIRFKQNTLIASVIAGCVVVNTEMRRWRAELREFSPIFELPETEELE